MKWFKDAEINNVNELRRAYKKLLMQYHPDNNEEDTTLQMQEINAEYDSLFKKLKDGYEHSDSYYQQTDRQRQAYDWQKDQQIREIIIELSKFVGLKIEICGTWVYVNGTTYPYRKELKALGLKFNPQKGCWIIHYDDYYKYHKNPVSMSYIRDKYGSVIIKTEEKEIKNRRIREC